ncbi:MAG: hypothetical protein OXF42_04610, partial [Candidatus Dadabacteria bacterium]|nr:hypothetical protein [Candidatus Dadabacteria bacterium]
MILRGIMGRSLGGTVCIRGFAPLGDLASVSKADIGYQRDLIKDQEETIKKFLQDKEYLFFPEIILSFNNIRNLEELQNIESGKKMSYAMSDEVSSSAKHLTLSGDLLTFDGRPLMFSSKYGYEVGPQRLIISSRKQKYNVSTDTGQLSDIRIATIELKGTYKFFHRIDGNHRLSAAEEFKDDPTITSLQTPFCLILLPQGGGKFEKTIFHNINFKHIPL